LPGQGRWLVGWRRNGRYRCRPYGCSEGKGTVREVHGGEWEPQLWDRVGQEAGGDAPDVELDGESARADHGIGLGELPGFRERWRGLTLPTAFARGCSVHHGGYRHRSQTARPGPSHVPGRVLVAVQDQAAGVTDVDTHAHVFGHAPSTPGAILTGIRWGDRFHALAGTCCRARENGEETTPSGVSDARSEARFPRDPLCR
jgi:hypothetical protein